MMDDPKLIEGITRESGQWVEAGIISGEQRGRILARYAAAAGGTERHNKLAGTITLLGSLLLGVGIILYFASNWQLIAPVAKMGILLASVLVSYGLGWWFSEKKEAMPGMGLAFYFLGAVLYGASIFLVAQAYNISAHWPNGVLWWGIGVVPLALLLDSRAISSLAIVVLSFWIGAELSFVLESQKWFQTIPLYGITYALWGCALLGLGILSGDRLAKAAAPLKTLGMFSVLAGSFVLTFKLHADASGETLLLSQGMQGKGTILAYFVSLSVIAAAAALNRKNREENTGLLLWSMALLAWAWIAALFVPPRSLWMPVVGNTVYFAGIIALLYIGYLRSRAFCVNLGLIAFAALVIARYFDFAWEYMDRSIAFICFGALLLLMGYGLERSRRFLLRKEAAR